MITRTAAALKVQWLLAWDAIAASAFSTNPGLPVGVFDSVTDPFHKKDLTECPSQAALN